MPAGMADNRDLRRSRVLHLAEKNHDARSRRP
jgi:hypothetical protein